MDHYQTLGVPRDASPEAIREAFRRLTRRHHPDTAPGATDKDRADRFETVKKAYDVLRDADARARYDESLMAGERGHQPHFTWTNIAHPRAGRPRRSAPERPDLDAMIDAYFGRWSDPG